MLGGRIIHSPQDGMGFIFLRKRLENFTLYPVTKNYWPNSKQLTDPLAICYNFISQSSAAFDKHHPLILSTGESASVQHGKPMESLVWIFSVVCSWNVWAAYRYTSLVSPLLLPKFQGEEDIESSSDSYHPQRELDPRKLPSCARRSWKRWWFCSCSPFWSDYCHGQHQWAASSPALQQGGNARALPRCGA